MSLSGRGGLDGPPSKSRGARHAGRLAGFVLLLTTLALWQLVSRLDPPEFILGPLEIGGHVVEALRSGELLPHVGASLVRSLPGFVVGSLLGVILGLLAGVARSLDQLLSPMVFLTYPVPKIVFLPIRQVVARPRFEPANHRRRTPMPTGIVSCPTYPGTTAVVAFYLSRQGARFFASSSRKSRNLTSWLLSPVSWIIQLSAVVVVYSWGLEC